MHEQPWRLTKLNGQFCLTFERDGKRVRRRLGTADPRQAKLIAPAVYAELTKPEGRTVADLWDGYIADRQGRAVVPTMGHTWKALRDRFGQRDGESITKEDCRAHTQERRSKGISDGTIHTELGHLRTVLKWAERGRLIERAPHIERPQKPEPKDRYLTRDEVRRIMEAAQAPHIKLAIHLMIATAARVTAILELTWDRVDFKRKQIILRDPTDKVRRKGRATVPMNDTIIAALRDAQDGAMTDHVIEWAGKPVSSLKRGIGTAARTAGIDGVSAHVFRHTSAVWMIEAGIPISEVSQYLGHANSGITEKVYARFSQDHLRKAASALELKLYVVPGGQPKPTAKNLK
jgi:integrase